MNRWLLVLFGVVLITALSLVVYWVYTTKLLKPHALPPQPTPKLKTASFSFNGRLLARTSLPVGWQVVADCAGVYYIDQGGNISCETAKANQTPVEVHIGDEAETYKKIVEIYNRSPEKTKTIDNKQAVSYKVHPANEPNTFYITYIIFDNNIFLNIRSKDETHQDIYNSIVNGLKFF